MAIVDKYEPGAPAWVELCTSDLSGARPFYEGLFGWTSFEMPVHNGAFVMMRRHGIDVAAMYEISAMQKEKGIAPHWLIYFASEDVDATADKVKAAGGGVIYGPFDIGSSGRSCFFTDRHGAMFAVWQAAGHVGSGIVNEPGTLCWAELATPDKATAKEFYGTVFGWKTKDNSGETGGHPMDYVEWMNGDKAIGGCLQMTGEWKGIPPHWMPYFQVESCAGSCTRIGALGGSVKYGPLRIEGVGEFAVAVDPQDVVFTVIELTAPGASA